MVLQPSTRLFVRAMDPTLEEFGRVCEEARRAPPPGAKANEPPSSTRYGPPQRAYSQIALTRGSAARDAGGGAWWPTSPSALPPLTPSSPAARRTPSSSHRGGGPLSRANSSATLMTPGSFATRSPTFNRMPSSSKTMMARSPSSRRMQLRKQSSMTSSKAGGLVVKVPDDFEKDLDEGSASSPRQQVQHLSDLTSAGEADETSEDLDDGSMLKLYFVDEADGSAAVEREVLVTLKDFLDDRDGYEVTNSERLLRVQLPDRRRLWYEGSRGQERQVKLDFPNGHVQLYEGEKDEERLVYTRYSDGKVKRYEGEHGAERLVCLLLPSTKPKAVAASTEEMEEETKEKEEEEAASAAPSSAEVPEEEEEEEEVYEQRIFFDGRKGCEIRVRAEHLDGRVSTFDETSGALVRIDLPDGRVRFFEGFLGREHLVRTSFPDGKTFYYYGKKDAEQRVCQEFSSGRTQYLLGEKGSERLHREHLPPSRAAKAGHAAHTRHYVGEQGKELLARLDGEGWSASVRKMGGRRSKDERANRYGYGAQSSAGDSDASGTTAFSGATRTPTSPSRGVLTGTPGGRANKGQKHNFFWENSPDGKFAVER